MEWGQQKATVEGVPVTLEASPTGNKLYKIMGFDVVKVLHVVDELEDGLAMLWEPASLKGRWLEADDSDSGHTKRIRQTGDTA